MPLLEAGHELEKERILAFGPQTEHNSAIRPVFRLLISSAIE